MGINLSRREIFFGGTSDRTRFNVGEVSGVIHPDDSSNFLGRKSYVRASSATGPVGVGQHPHFPAYVGLAQRISRIIRDFFRLPWFTKHRNQICRASSTLRNPRARRTRENSFNSRSSINKPYDAGFFGTKGGISVGPWFVLWERNHCELDYRCSIIPFGNVSFLYPSSHAVGI